MYYTNIVSIHDDNNNVIISNILNLISFSENVRWASVAYSVNIILLS